MTRVQTMVQLTSDIVAALDAKAVREGVSRSAIIRTALEEYLADSRWAQQSAGLIQGYSAIPQGATDEWGAVTDQTRSNTQRVLQRLDAEEEAAGTSW